MSAVILNKLLYEKKIQYKQNGDWLIYYDHQNKDYTKAITHIYTHEKGEIQIIMMTVWT